MRIFKEIKKFFDAPRAIRGTSTEKFAEIDVEDIRKRTNLEKIATSDGKANRPGPNENKYSAVELDLRATFQQYQQHYLDEYDKWQEVYKNRIEKERELWDLDAIDNLERALVSDVIVNAKAKEGRVYQKQEILKATAKELFSFRKKHQLLDRQPANNDKLLSYALLACFLLIEFFITVSFALEILGLNVAIISSILFCFLNCMVPFFARGPSRWIFYKPKGYIGRKITGWICLILLSIFGVGFNLMLGHYRYASIEVQKKLGGVISSDIESLRSISEIAAGAGSKAMSQFLQSPLHLGDVTSVTLVIAGLVAFILSWADGVFKEGDYYPEYTSKKDAFLRPYDAYLKEVSSILDQLKSDRRIAAKKIEKQKKIIQNSIEDVPKTMGQADILPSQCQNAMLILETRYRQLVMEYRQKNRAERVNPAPEYFNDEVNLPAFELTKPVFSNVTQDNHQNLVEKFDHFTKKLHHEFESVIKNLEDNRAVLKDEHPLRVI